MISEDMANMQCRADAEDYLYKGYKLTDGRIERYYRNNTTVCYSYNEFIDMVHQIAEDTSCKR